MIIRPPCVVGGCAHRASWMPVLLLRPEMYTGDPLRAMLGLPMCTDCKEAATVASMVTDEGWAAIAASVVRSGKAEPARERTELTFIHYDSPEAKQQRLRMKPLVRQG